jgi:hypothetical protein
MKRTLALVCAFSCFVLTAQAAPRWQGPGWYQVVEKLQPGREGRKIILAPQTFANKAECQRTLQRDRVDGADDDHGFDVIFDFSCEELPVRPVWDR